MLRVRIIRGRILLQVRILPFSGHHRHMPDVRCQPESALCLVQPSDPHSPAAAATCPQQVERLFVGSGRVAEALQCIHVEWSPEKGTNKSRLRLLQALAEDGGPVSTQPDRAGKLPYGKDPRPPERTAVHQDGTPSEGAARDPEPVADVSLAGIHDPRAFAAGCGRSARVSAGF